MTAERRSGTVEVVDPGPLSTLQDRGRRGWAHLGVPRAGALDRGAAALARRLVGGGPDDAVIETTVGGVRVCSVYVVNGRELGSSWFAEKLTFLDAMVQRAEELRDGDVPVAIAGDFNVCPHDVDVYDPAAFAGSTLVTAEERSRVDALLERGGLVDAYRVLHPLPEVGYTWWDYRAGHFHKKLGLRIDLVCVSASLADALIEVGIRRDFRKGTKPSDPIRPRSPRRGVPPQGRVADPALPTGTHRTAFGSPADEPPGPPGRPPDLAILPVTLSVLWTIRPRNG